mmetsp:Transcript_66800/g.120237  ORF Transcript_66800/g.120237 Transcript_66800/m.120237 type:complete len:191 (+) Transcript_66800:3-575(+)
MVLQNLGESVLETCDCRDVEWDVPFIYFLEDVETADVKLEVFIHSKGEEKESLGRLTMGVADLLQKPGNRYDFERLELKGGSQEKSPAKPRLTGRLQLWAIGATPPAMPTPSSSYTAVPSSYTAVPSIVHPERTFVAADGQQHIVRMPAPAFHGAPVTIAPPVSRGAPLHSQPTRKYVPSPTAPIVQYRK